MGIRILSTNYNGYSTDITFSPATGGTQVINNAVIPYDFVTNYPYGDYSIYIPSFNNTCTLNVPVPTYEANISPSGATQYENVILSASTDLTNPTYVWTLTDFNDTSGNTISSYTGNPVTEGYFSSSGNSNVSLSVVGEDPWGIVFTATTTTFDVSAFNISSLQSDMEIWVDFNDSSTLTLRTGTNYIEEITNKGTSNITLLNETTAANQPLLTSGETFNTGLTFAKFGNVMGDTERLASDNSWTGSTWDFFSVVKTSSNDYSATGGYIASVRDKVGGGFAPFIEMAYIQNEFLPAVIGNRLRQWVQDDQFSYNVRFRLSSLDDFTGFTGVINTTYSDSYPGFRNSGYTSNLIEVSGLTYSLYDYTAPFNNQLESEFMLGNSFNYDRALNGNIGEVIQLKRVATDTERNQINRYLYHKWVV